MTIKHAALVGDVKLHEPKTHAASHASTGADSVDHDTLTNTHNLTSDIDHNQLTNYAANEHIDWTNATESLSTTGTATSTGFHTTSAYGIVQDVAQSFWMATFNSGLGVDNSGTYFDAVGGNIKWRLLNSDIMNLNMVSGELDISGNLDVAGTQIDLGAADNATFSIAGNHLRITNNVQDGDIEFRVKDSVGEYAAFTADGSAREVDFGSKPRTQYFIHTANINFQIGAVGSTPTEYLQYSSASDIPMLTSVGTGALRLRGSKTDGAGVIACEIGNDEALTNATAQILSLYSDNFSTERFAFFADGYLHIKTKAAASAAAEALRLHNTGSGGGTGATIDFYHGPTATKNARIRAYGTGANQGDLYFEPANGGSFNTMLIMDGSAGDATWVDNAKTQYRDVAIGIYSQANTFLDLFADGAIRIGDSSAGAPTNYINISATGDITFAGSSGLYPRTLNQADEPEAGTGATQLDTSEMCVWTDSDDSACYLSYNHGGTVKTVALT